MSKKSLVKTTPQIDKAIFGDRAKTKEIDSFKIGDVDQHIDRFEVVLAYNIRSPYRYSQEYFWLEVMSSSASDAVNLAFDWYLEQKPQDFEFTGFVRKMSPHVLDLDLLRGNIRVSWDIPIERSLAPGTMVRHPSTGIRIGFVASDPERFLKTEDLGLYRLISRKPAPGADPVILAPIVDLIKLAE